MSQWDADLQPWIDRWGTAAVDADAPVTVEVPLEEWVAAATSARDDLGATWFDSLTVVDEADGRFTVLLHLRRRVAPAGSLIVRTVVADGGRLPSVAEVFAGAAWHEREQAEMFGVTIDGLPDPRRLLLPVGFSGAPLRKDFVLAARAARPWPGVKEPGESDADVAEGAAAERGVAEGGVAEGGVAEGGRASRRRRRRAAPTGVPERAEDGRW